MTLDANLRLGRLAASSGPSFATGADLLQMMDRFGISQALVYHALARESDYHAGNQLLHSLILGHDRLIPCFVAVPNREDPGTFVRSMNQHAVPALRLFPRSHHFSIRPWCIAGLAQALTEHRKTLLIDFEGPHWASEGIDWEGIDQLCTAHPNLPVIVCGVTVAGPSNFTPLMARHQNLCLEVSQLITPRQISQLVDTGYGKRLVFGSDMPSRHIAGPLTMIALQGITPAQKQAILHDNMAGLLGISPPRCATPPLTIPRYPRIIDTHVHLGGWNNSTPDPGNGRPSHIVSEMDRTGISAVVATSLWSCYGEVAAGNRDVAQACANHPGRIYGYLTLDPKHPDEVRQQIDTHAQNPGFVGIKVHCATHAINITDPRFDPILSYADSRAWPVLIHGNFTPEPWREICPRYPRAKPILAHLAGCGFDMPCASDVARLCRQFPNFYFDLASSSSHYRFLNHLIDLAGADHILYGSDHPLFDFAFELGQVLHADISDEDKQLILWKNAARIFHLTK